jgi:hypothetical protein
VKVTETFHTSRKLSTIAGVYGVPLRALVTVVAHSGRGALGAKFDVGDSLSGLESEGATGIVDCKGEA